MARLKTQKSKSRHIIRRLLTGLLLVVLLLALFVYGGRALCYIAMQQLGELTNTKIRTESVAFHMNGSVFIKKLAISPDEEENGSETILTAKKVHARFSLISLLLLRPQLKIIDIDDFVFNAQYDVDTGRWNLSALELKPPKGEYHRMPRVRLKEGTLQYSKISNEQVEVAISVPLNARFGFDKEKGAEAGYSFEITTATMASGFGKSRLTGFWRPGRVTVAGGIASTDVPKLEMAWIINLLAAELQYDENNAFSLKLRIQDLQSKRSPSLDGFALVGPPFLERSSPFTALQKFFDRYQPRGKVDMDLEASGNFNNLSESVLAGTVHCKDIAFRYYKFQYAIEHLTGQIGFTKDSITLNNLSGKHGDIGLFFNGWSSDFGPDWKYQIRITSDRMPLDNDLYSALSAKQQEFWSAFSPTGSAAIDYQLSRKSQTEKDSKLTIGLLGADAVYQHFPYPLKNLTGKLSLDRNKVVFSDLVSQVNDRRITVNGEVINHSTDNQTYDISVELENIPLDSTLEAALPERQKTLYRQFCPTGLADGWVKAWTQDSGAASFSADLSFKEAFFESEQLPLPICDISASAVLTPDLITVKNFSGRYGQGLVSLTGQIWPDQEQQQSRYHLVLDFEQNQVNDDLFTLLPDSVKAIACKLNLSGKVNLSADLNKEDLTSPPDYRISVECLGNSINFPKFPYPMKDITGTFVIDADSIKLEGVAATLDANAATTANPATVELNGELTLADSTSAGRPGPLSSVLLNLSANDIRFDEQLSLLLPQRAQPLYGKLSPTGRFDLDFENIRMRYADDGQKSFDFDGIVTLKDCGVRISDAWTELDTGLRARGLYKTSSGLNDCRATIEGGTVKIHGKSFTNVRANIHYDPNSRNWSTEDLVADCYGGKVKGEFHFKQPHENVFEYVLQTGFDNIDLKQFLSDTEPKATRENDYSSGQMDGSLSINARAGDDSSRIGACRLAISDMQVGKLSPMAKLLQVLRLTEPKDFAFDRMFVDSYIKQNGLFVKKLDLSGQGFAFHGSGRMDIKSRDVDLTLTARGRRLATDDPSVLQSLTEGLGRAVVRMDVTGDVYDPEIETKALPVIEETLQVLGAKAARD